MRGDAPENDATDPGAAATEETTSGGRRASIVMLQHLMKRVPHSSSPSQYTTLVSSPSDSSGSSANESRNKQSGEQEVIHVSPEDGVNVARINPFHAHNLESGSQGQVTEDDGVESNLNTHFVPPPGFQSSPLDLQPEVQTVENGDKFSELQKDLFHPWTLAQNSSDSDHLPLNNLFKANPSRTPDLPRTSDLFKGAELFQAAAQADKSPGIFMDPFKSPSNQANGLLQSSQSAVGNPFHTASASEADLFQAVPTNVKDNRDPFTKENGLFGVASEENRDLFSSSSTSAVDPFPSPVARDLFQDLSSVEDPFGPTPSKQHDPFHDVSSGTPDFFLPLPSKADSRDVFQTVPSNAAFSRPSFNCASETRLDPLMSPGLFRATESPPVDRPTTSSSRVVLTTPRGTKHAVLHPTPFSQARNLSVSPSQSLGEMTHVQTFKRPPKPLPRTRPRRPEKLPTPEKTIEPEPTQPTPSLKPALSPLPKPVVRRKPKTPDNQPVEPENYVVFEDILLTGQERCVEDWPDDSPELNPEFRPVKTDSDGGSGEDQDASGARSKEKFVEDMKDGRSRTLPTSPKSSQKKPLRTRVNQLLRRASAASALPEGRHGPQVQHDDDKGKKSIGKKNSITRRWSEGTALDNGPEEEEEQDGGESQHEEKRKNKMKIKFVPHRGFAITSKRGDDEVKGARGFTPPARSRVRSRSPSTSLFISQGDAFEDVGEMKVLRVQSTSKKKPTKTKLLHVARRSSKVVQLPASSPQDDGPTGRDFLGGGEMFYSDEEETYKLKKSQKLKGFRRSKVQAEWFAARKDERALAGWEDEEEDGDTDSLMEWWNNVEQWDEVPSDDDNVVMEDESKSFSVLADKVHRGLRVFNKAFTERAEVLWQSIITLHAIADDIRDFHQKAKIAGITGGTTTAVGGVTAIAGLALAPFTFGASLVVTAVGVGVATAGGIASASAAISDNVNNMHDRKKVETVLREYEGHLLHIGKILHFVDQGVYKLRGHPFLRSGTQHYSEDWEVRRTVQILCLVDSPVMRATGLTDAAVATVQSLFKGMDKYFIKDSRELKKGCRREVVSQIKQVANMLNDTIVELNAVREELHDATGHA
ncbi:putative apolipoprotein L6-like [Scophthalmus maximus]|uniref:Putative apolipoprotein L6-like n=1 Tax=Scophthalmus maximus TaxID=52904 RepID=A0A2U9B024_SCOMX|nr:putative apolipoprotein L6-like [Scophthalmus maximus]